MEKRASKAIEIATAASLIGSSIAGCSPTPQSNTYENTPIPKEPNATEISNQPIEEISYHQERIISDSNQRVDSNNEIPEIFAEKKSFDFDILNIADWSNFELEDVEEKEPGYGIDVVKETSLFMIPLKKDNFFDDSKEVKEILAPSGSTFEIAEIRTLEGPNGEKIKIGNIANTFGASFVSTVVLEAEDSNGIKESFTKEREDEYKTVTYIATEDFAYPNKIENILVALRDIATFQKENEGFKEGQEYSYIDLINLKNQSYQYKSGLTTTGGIVRGGGVCAMSTGISSLIHVQDKEYKVLERWAEAERYIQGPFSPSKYIVDSSVDYNDTNTYDLRWVQGEDKYLNINISLSPSDISFEQTAQDGVGGISDVIMLVSLSFRDQPQENQEGYLTKILKQYQGYRDSNHNTKLNELQMDVNILNHPITPEIFDSVDLIYNIQDIREFESIIAEKEQLQDILKLQEAVNSYDENSGIPIEKYLKETEWYKTFKDEESRKEADRRIMHATISRVQGQPLQCVGFVMLVSSLYPELSIPYVGGVQATTARELIPPVLREYNYTDVIVRNAEVGGAVALGGALTIDMYKPGDLFIRKDGANAASTQKPTGHIGVILEKIVKENGKVVLLVADSNRDNDGRIKIFSVDESNLEEVFGQKTRYVFRIPN